jgi:hypothetical protein
VFVREDLPDTVKLVQASHACMEMGFETKKPKEQVFLVALSVKNEEGLVKVADLLEQDGIKFKMFYEPDYNYGYTALCTKPVLFGKYETFGRYNLMKIGT